MTKPWGFFFFFKRTWDSTNSLATSAIHSQLCISNLAYKGIQKENQKCLINPSAPYLRCFTNPNHVHIRGTVRSSTSRFSFKCNIFLSPSFQKCTTCFEEEMPGTGNSVDTLFSNLWHRRI